MSKLTQGQVLQALMAGGFTEASARTLSGISGAETGGTYDPNVLGDLGLQNATWGPSVGVFQIRTLKAETGRGTARDIQWLQGSLPHQVAAAYEISAGGRNFTPWSTYTSGKYTQYLPGSGQLAQDAGLWGKTKGLLGDGLGAVTDPLVNGIEEAAVTLGFALLGVALVAGGVYATFGRQIRAGAGAVLKAAPVL